MISKTWATPATRHQRLAAHRVVQLTAESWMVDPRASRTFPPYLDARRGDLGAYTLVVDADGETIVQGEALRIE